jgi:hypothetical protein
METAIYHSNEQEGIGYYVPGTTGMEHTKACALAYWLNANSGAEGQYSVVGGEQDAIDIVCGRTWLQQLSREERE